MNNVFGRGSLQEVKVEFLRSDGEAWTQRGHFGLFNVFKANCPGIGRHEGGSAHLDQRCSPNIFLPNDWTLIAWLLGGGLQVWEGGAPRCGMRTHQAQPQSSSDPGEEGREPAPRSHEKGRRSLSSPLLIMRSWQLRPGLVRVKPTP